MEDLVCGRFSIVRRCNNSQRCSKIGGFGIGSFDSHRKCFMLLLSLFALISTITSLISIISMSKNSTVIQNTCWTIGSIDSTDTTMYIGLKSVLIENSHHHLHSLSWSDSNCTMSYCDQCEVACENTIKATIITFLISIPTITTNLKRSVPESDFNCTKLVSILLGVIGTLTALISISFYLDGCYRHLPEYSTSGSEIDYSFGPGLVCILIPVLLKPIDVLVNVFTPVGSQPRVTEFMEYDHKLLLYDEDRDESTVEL